MKTEQDVVAEVAGCFPRRDSRLLAGEMTHSMLMELERRNCWTLAEALGRDGPHRLRRFLSRGAWDHDLARDQVAAWTAGELGDEQAVLVTDDTGDEKSSRDCVGAARQCLVVEALPATPTSIAGRDGKGSTHVDTAFMSLTSSGGVTVD